jgi:hypothetical protein
MTSKGVAFLTSDAALVLGLCTDSRVVRAISGGVLHAADTAHRCGIAFRSTMIKSEALSATLNVDVVSSIEDAAAKLELAPAEEDEA